MALANYTSLSNLTTKDNDAIIKVRVTRIWDNVNIKNVDIFGLHLTLLDETNKLAIDFDSSFKDHDTNNVVIVVTGVLVKNFRGNNMVSSTTATKVYYNIDEERVQKLLQGNTHNENNLQLVTSSVNFFDTQPETIKVTEETLYEVVYLDAPGTSQEYFFISDVQIIGVVKELDWRYVGCPLVPKKHHQLWGVWCRSCNKEVMAQLRYKVTIEMKDHSAITTFVLFNKEAEKLIKISAYELEKNVNGKELFPDIILAIIGKTTKVQVKSTRYNYAEGNEGFTISKIIHEIVDNKQHEDNNTSQDIASQESTIINLTDEFPPATPFQSQAQQPDFTPISKPLLTPKIEKIFKSSLLKFSNLNDMTNDNVQKTIKPPKEEECKKRKIGRQSSKRKIAKVEE
ncbi:uncharacterized protein A4U43_C05F28150 [Asparagus officinalis]|uniref:Replication factor A C-terminal domain-containing protein n=1 Tax=Asparagus officinalis TaxID=4686 RepID=A0A5P1EWM9_ASPOF|nr:uncharacterized protein A4U43_C05F28150 [Asparagus officinalis]